MGLIETLTYPENWQQFEGGMSREDAACYWQEIVDSLYASAEGEGECVDCCPTFQTDPATGLPKVSYDDGLTWDYFPSGAYDPAMTDPIAPPPPPLEKGSDDADRCYAAWNATDVIANFYQQTAGQAAAGLYNTILNVNKFLYELNQSLLRLIYPSEAQVAQALGFFNFDWPTYASAPTLDSDAIDALRCLLYDNAEVSSGVVSFDYETVTSTVESALGTNPGVAVHLLIGYMGQAGLNAAGGVQVNSSADCSSCDEWTHVFDFTVSNGGFTAAHGTWVSGTGWQGANAAGGRWLQMGLTFDSRTITAFSIEGTTTGVATIGWNRSAQAGAVGGSLTNRGTGSLNQSWTGSSAATSIGVDVTNNNPSTVITISKITISGTGTDPF